jgi:hypothetical protein
LPLERLLSALMITQIIFQFIPQIFAVFALHLYRKDIPRPYRMWLYPLPALVALVGWAYVASTPDQRQFVGSAAVLLVLGIGGYLLRAKASGSWPMAAPRQSRSTAI